MNLGVNIDHIATLRQARYAGSPDSRNIEPDLAVAAAVAERAGASGITIHLRADRRHIQDRDVLRLRETINTKLNLEMGNTKEIVDLALQILPEEVCLVPENRQEVTTEGGLDVTGQIELLKPTVHRLQAVGIRVSFFIEPIPDQIESAAKLHAQIVELHTGAYANAQGREQHGELMRLKGAAEHAHGFGLQVNAGHGINYTNIEMLRSLPHLAELNIGHSIISRAVIVGLGAAVEEMLAKMNPGA
jgi:pyridoxine 5-phosphate synthase